MPVQYLISACLIGEPVRYDGGHCLQQQLKTLISSGQAIAFCPEVAGGLSTPRPPTEIQHKANKIQVVDITGQDCTDAFIDGAQKALNIVQQHQIKHAILKANSPSCGSGQIYDGTFTGQKIQGDGMTAALLKKHGIEIMTETEYLTQLP